jgi:hypothetical protein
MRHAPSTLHFTHAFRSPAPAGAIEWEELPSLSGSLARRLVLLGAARAADPGRFVASGNAWDSTRPAELESIAASAPFREPLDGLAVREVSEPDVFRHFFGA